MKRRKFLQRLAYGTAGCMFASTTVVCARKQDTDQQRRLPYKIDIRQASLRNPEDPSKRMIANIDTFKVARDIPGITGVELQVTGGHPNMRDLSVARRYKAEAHRRIKGLSIPEYGVLVHPLYWIEHLWIEEESGEPEEQNRTEK